MLGSDERANRVLRLIRPMLWAGVMTVLGVTAITVSILLAMGFGPWWESLASVIGIAAIASVGTSVAHACRHRAAQSPPAIVDPTDVE